MAVDVVIKLRVVKSDVPDPEAGFVPPPIVVEKLPLMVLGAPYEFVQNEMNAVLATPVLLESPVGLFPQ